MSKLFLSSLILSLLLASACANSRFFMRFTQEVVDSNNSTLPIPDNANITIPENANLTIPENSNVTIPEDANVTVSDNSTIPLDQNTTLPQDQNTTLPQDQNTTIPQNNSSSGPSFWETNSTQFIKVIGRSSGKIRFGQAIIGLTLESIDRSASNSLQNNTSIVNSTMDRLKSLGLSEEDIQVSGIQVFPFYDQSSIEQPQNTTVIVNNSTVQQDATAPQNSTDDSIVNGNGDFNSTNAFNQTLNSTGAFDENQDLNTDNLFNQTLNSTGAFDENQDLNTDNLFNQTLNSTGLFNETTPDQSGQTNQTVNSTTEQPQQEQSSSSISPYSFRVRHSIVITTNQTDLVGQILDQAMQGGFNQVDFVNYLPLDDDIQAQREQLIGDAIDHAERSARKVIEKLGFEMGPVMNITLLEDQSNNYDIMYAMDSQIFNPPIDYDQTVEVVYWMRQSQSSSSN